MLMLLDILSSVFFAFTQTSNVQVTYCVPLNLICSIIVFIKDVLHGVNWKEETSATFPKLLWMIFIIVDNSLIVWLHTFTSKLFCFSLNIYGQYIYVLWDSLPYKKQERPNMNNNAKERSREARLQRRLLIDGKKFHTSKG